MVSNSEEQSGLQPDPIEQRARQLFDAGAASLDAHTLSRLNQARHTALDAARKDRVVMPHWLMPAGSAAAMALVAVVTVQYMRDAPHAEVNTSVNALEDMDIIASNEELDLLQDVDFYDWLDAADAPDSEAT
jgi:hypothetical protein